MSKLVIGLGNRDRRDDAVGLVVADRLRDRVAAAVRTCEGTDLDLLALWEGYERVIVLDAARCGAPAGTISRFGADAAELAHPRGGGSHGFGLAAAVALARRLGRLPPRLEVRTVAVVDAGHGRGLSPPVADAADRLVGELVRELAPAGDPRSPV